MNNGEIITLNYRFVSFPGTQQECCEKCCMGESPFACHCPPDMPDCENGYYERAENIVDNPCKQDTERKFLAEKILCSMLRNPNRTDQGRYVDDSVEMADSLLEKLRG